MSKSLTQNESYYKLMLIDYLLNNYPKAIFASEYPFYFSKRRADLLLVESNYTHAIEIKSDVDNTYSLEEQLNDYRKSFNKVSILISEKHMSILPGIHKSVGILILKDGELIVKRHPKIKKKLDKGVALDLLSTQKLSSLTSSRLSRVEMIESLSNILTFKQVNDLAFESVKNKISPIFDLFKTERGLVTTIQDLDILAMRSTLLSTY